MNKLFHILLFQILLITAYAQQSNSTFGRNYSIFLEKGYNFIGSGLHTSVKPYFFSNHDSVLVKYEGSWMSRKWNKEHFLQVNREDYKLIINPILHIEIGRELGTDKITWTNTRGIVAEGKIGKRFIFHSSFLENQAVFPLYITNNILEGSSQVVPGQGESHFTSDSVFDYAMASGHFSYQMSKFSNLQFGTGKNFIGDGYRSMILSDNAFNYPYLKIQTNAGIFQYTNLYMEHIDMTSNPSKEFTYDRKYMTLHHLSANISDRLNIGIYESIIWRNNRNPEISGFDIAYLNPIIFLRPVEFSLNSSDNSLMGMNFKFKCTNTSHLYGQFVIDELSPPALKDGNDWWGNKYSYQIGGKYYDILSIKNLILQIENNFARPYIYSHHSVAQNYGHYDQSLAHPLGANFNETLIFLDYKYKKFEMHIQYMITKFGDKKKNDPTSFGNDIFLSSSDRPSDYDIEMYQGNLSKLDYKKIIISYLINPKTNFKFESGYISRILKNDDGNNTTNFVFFALKSDLFNRYYDY